MNRKLLVFKLEHKFLSTDAIDNDTLNERWLYISYCGSVPVAIKQSQNQSLENMVSLGDIVLCRLITKSAGHPIQIMKRIRGNATKLNKPLMMNVRK